MFMTTLLTILFILLVIYIIYQQNKDIVYVKSNIDDNTYIIRRGNLKDIDYLQESADTLAKINKNILNLIDHLSIKYANKTTPYYHNIIKLREHYNHAILSEAALDKRYTTYTINKQDMHICLRTRDTNEDLYDINTLMYVILHELAHLCNYDLNDEPIIGHGDEFRHLFKFLVQESMDIGIYIYIDYTKNPKEYCGIIISTQIV